MDYPTTSALIVPNTRNNSEQPLPIPIVKKIASLPEVIKRNINTFLNAKEQSNFICNREQYALFQTNRLLAVFLKHVVNGNQETASGMLTMHPELLLVGGSVTDYAGRTFKNIYAYEYAYWAMEAHMDASTKATMLERVEAIERYGLTYEQHNRVFKRSKHFDMTPLKEAYQQYIDGYSDWSAANNHAAMKTAWFRVGLIQRDLPVHVLNEYCRTDRAFFPLPTFAENLLPRTDTFRNSIHNLDFALFQLMTALGTEFTLCRGNTPYAYSGQRSNWGPTLFEGVPALVDLDAVSRLDEVRTQDLAQSRENLRSAEPEHFLGSWLS